MMDSYRAPENLAAARRRVDAAVAKRCRDLGLQDGQNGDDSPVVARLRGRTFGSQRQLISGDTVCVVSDAVLWRWDAASLQALADALSADRYLVFLEPTADLGWRRGVHRMTRRIWRIALRHDFEADVPARLREAGLVVTTTDRFGIGPFALRSYVWGVAQQL